MREVDGVKALQVLWTFYPLCALHYGDVRKPKLKNRNRYLRLKTEPNLKNPNRPSPILHHDDSDQLSSRCAQTRVVTLDLS